MTPFCSVYLLFCADFHDMFDRCIDLLPARHGNYADDLCVAPIGRNQYARRGALPDSGGHARRDFAKHRVGKRDADGADDHISVTALHHHGVFTGCAMLRSCVDHAAGGQGVCADGDDGMPYRQACLEQAFDDLGAKTAALAVYDQELHSVHLAESVLDYYKKYVKLCQESRMAKKVNRLAAVQQYRFTVNLTPHARSKVAHAICRRDYLLE